MKPIEVKLAILKDSIIEKDGPVFHIRAGSGPYRDDDFIPASMGIFGHWKSFFSYAPSLGAIAMQKDSMLANSAYYIREGHIGFARQNLPIPYNINTLVIQELEKGNITLRPAHEELSNLLTILYENTQLENDQHLIVEMSRRTYCRLPEIKGVKPLDHGVIFQDEQRTYHLTQLEGDFETWGLFYAIANNLSTH